jgi:2'-5' RNA ligase
MLPAVSQVHLRTALLIPVPEAEPAVGRWRQLFDPSAQSGVPPHITLIFPYLSSDRCDTRVLGMLREMFRRVPEFDYALSEFGEFPGVVFLKPRPNEPFIALIKSLADRFPEAPPYGGSFPTIIPHLTIAHSDDATEMAKLSADVSCSLPIRCHAHEVHLMREMIDGQWHLSERFGLGKQSDIQ